VERDKNMSLISVWLLVLLGLSASVIYLMAIALLVINKMSDRVTETNKQLLVLVAHREGGNDAARAVLASTKLPKNDLPGISTEKKKKKEPPQKDGDSEGYSVKVGVR
jgi:hypothetical protein